MRSTITVKKFLKKRTILKLKKFDSELPFIEKY